MRGHTCVGMCVRRWGNKGGLNKGSHLCGYVCEEVGWGIRGTYMCGYGGKQYIMNERKTQRGRSWNRLESVLTHVCLHMRRWGYLQRWNIPRMHLERG